MKSTDAKAVKRRAFLKGTAVTTVAVGSGAVNASNITDTDSTPKSEPGQQGYQESRHVKEYYRKARF